MRSILILIMVALTSVSAAWARNGDTAADSVAAGGVKSIPDGKYIYVPDSLQKDVLRLLTGGGRVVDNPSSYTSADSTLWHGDTIPLILRDRNIARSRFERGLFNHLYIPKGNWKFGLTASYGEFDSDDMEIMSLLSDIDLNIHVFSIRPSVSYFIKNNLSVGLRFGYTSARGSIDSFKVDIDEDMNFNLHDIMYRNEGYTAAVTLTQYYGLARRGRFSIFNEVELAFSSGNSDFQRPYAGELRTTHTTYMDASLNFSPGVSVFIMKNASFNVSFGVFGYHIRNEKQTENGEEKGNRLTSGANFRFNIFNIKFGIGIHL